MKINVKSIFFFLIANAIILLFLEIFFTIFFFYHSSNYYGPIARIFYNSEIEKKEPHIYKIKWNKATQKMLPGVYENNGVEFTVNSLGFATKEFTLENKSNCRIISFGGSTTLGIETDSPYTKILEKKLKSNEFNCEVLNLGFSGMGLNFIENLLVTEAINYSPNIITIMSNRNSVMYDSYNNSAITPDIISNNIDFYKYKLRKFLFSEVMTYRFLELSTKGILGLLYNKENIGNISTDVKILSPYDKNTYHLKNYFTSKYENQLNNIINFSRKHGARVVLIKQPHYLNMKLQRKLKLISKEEIINKLLNYDKEKNNDKTNLFWIYTNAILNKSLDNIKLKNPDVIIVDPTESLYQYKEEVNFVDGIHLTVHGNEIIASKIMLSIHDEVKKLTRQ